MQRDTPIRIASRLLSPDAPNQALARLIQRPKAVARSYARGDRRASLEALKQIQEALRERARACWALSNCGGELFAEIARREQEARLPKSLYGCCSPAHRAAKRCLNLFSP